MLKRLLIVTQSILLDVNGGEGEGMKGLRIRTNADGKTRCCVLKYNLDQVRLTCLTTAESGQVHVSPRSP